MYYDNNVILFSWAGYTYVLITLFGWIIDTIKGKYLVRKSTKINSNDELLKFSCFNLSVN